MMKDTITFRYRMSDRDVFYGGGVVNGVEVKKVRLYTPCFAGDYMEYIAGIRKQEGNKVLIEVRSFKIIEVPADPPYPSSIDVLEDPPLSTVVQFWYEY